MIAALTLVGAADPASAQDAYVIGVTGALTGPVASTQAPAMEAMRIYMERVNANGGINGKQVRIILQDDAAEPSKAAANAKKLITQDNVVLLVNASLSSTYAPTVTEAKRAGVPLLFASGVCPKDVYPPADSLQFCTTAYASNYDSRAALAFVKEIAKDPVKMGFAAMAIPLSRGEMEFAASQAPALGIAVVGKEVIPPPTPDYTPFATKLKEAEANWVFSWAPWVTEVRTLEALRRLGWEGHYIAWSHLEAEGELPRLKDGNFYVVGANSLFQEDLPIHREIADAARKANSSYPGNQMAEGWIAGMVMEAALKSAGWPADAAKVRAALETVKVDTKGLRGGAFEFTKDNHFRTNQYYRVYRWDPAKSAIVVAKDWMTYAVK
jgi:ABC-type branched-subunit amino acid transport system substrate-binding protein